MASTANETAAVRPLSPRRTALIASPKRETPSAAVTRSPASANLRRAYHGDVEVLYLLAQRIAIEPQETGSAQLIPACCPKSQGQERALDLGNDTIVHAVRRQALAMGDKKCLQVAVDGVGQGNVAAGDIADLGPLLDGGNRVGQLGLDRLDADHLFRIERRQPAHEVDQLADVARPAVLLQPRHRLRRQ